MDQLDILATEVGGSVTSSKPRKFVVPGHIGGAVEATELIVPSEKSSLNLVETQFWNSGP